jgi:hypothetical protein
MTNELRKEIHFWIDLILDNKCEYLHESDIDIWIELSKDQTLGNIIYYIESNKIRVKMDKIIIKNDKIRIKNDKRRNTKDNPFYWGNSQRRV